MPTALSRIRSCLLAAILTSLLIRLSIWRCPGDLRMPRRLKGLQPKQTAGNLGDNLALRSLGYSGDQYPRYLSGGSSKAGDIDTCTDTFGPNPVVAPDVIRSLSDEMPSILQRLVELSRVHLPAATVNVTRAYNAMLATCVDSKQWRHAWFLVKKMVSESIPPDGGTINQILLIIRQLGKYEHALDLFNQLDRMGIKPDKTTFDALVDVCQRSAKFDEAAVLIKRMKRDGIQPDLKTYNLMMKAYERAEKWIEVLKTLQVMTAAGITPNKQTFTLLTIACKEGAQKGKALELFEILKTSTVQMNSGIYSALKALVLATEKTGCWKASYEILTQMNRFQIIPDIITYNSVINNLCSNSQSLKAYEVFQSMADNHVNPISTIYTNILGSLLEHQHWNIASKVYDQLRKENTALDMTQWNNIVTQAKESLLSVLPFEYMSRMEASLQHEAVVYHALHAAQNKLFSTSASWSKSKSPPGESQLERILMNAQTPSSGPQSELRMESSDESEVLDEQEFSELVSSTMSTSNTSPTRTSV